MQTAHERNLEKDCGRLQIELGSYSSVERFGSKYAKTGTKRPYLFQLNRYLRYLREVRRVTFTPDELIIDNLKCIFESNAIDVQRKRKHTDWLLEYLNKHLLERGEPESSRNVIASILKQFYVVNDSALFGDFSVSSQPVRPPPPPLQAEDIRKVLKALPPQKRLPLLILWQSSAEINRVLSLAWKDVSMIEKGEFPLKWTLYGRKKHKKTYHTYLGRNSIELLKPWKEDWRELQGREPLPEDLVFMGKACGPMDRNYLNLKMRDTAVKLHLVCIAHPMKLQLDLYAKASPSRAYGVSLERSDNFT